MHWVDKICSEFDISINELARRARISPGVLGNCKNRGTCIADMKYNNVLKIAKSLDMSPDILVRRYKY